MEQLTGRKTTTGIKSENSMKKVFNRLRNEDLIELVLNKRGAKSA